MLKIGGGKASPSKNDGKQRLGSHYITALTIAVAFHNPHQSLPAKLLCCNGS
jgi:hypothetical protein